MAAAALAGRDYRDSQTGATRAPAAGTRGASGEGQMSTISDESIAGLLLRAYARVAAQSHGEEFLHHNIAAKCDYDMALQSIESAIRSVHNAEIRQFGRKTNEDK
jgi:hypothetical protein